LAAAIHTAEVQRFANHDAIGALRADLKVLGRRFGLRAISIKAEPESEPKRQN
jgi:hypothetical protein